MPPVAQPTLNEVNPKYGTNNLATRVSMVGSNFLDGVEVFVGSEPVQSLVRNDSNTLTFYIPSGMLPGAYDITAVNPGSEEPIPSLVNAFRVIYPLPALPFDQESQESILARMLQSAVDNGIDVVQGSWAYDIFSALALEIYRSYVRANDIVINTFPQYARAGFLDLIGEEFGIVRLPATRSFGEVTFTGNEGATIPEGSLVSTVVAFGQLVSPIVFETTETGVVSGGDVTVPVIAQRAGASGNVSAGQITRLVSGISGITGVTNAEATIGGTSVETDDSYRIRMLNEVQNPSAGGNQQDYINWVNEVSGVGSVSVVPLGRGPGTVDVYILDDNMEVPDQDIIDAVQEYLSPQPGMGIGKAPIGADVLVQAPSLVSVDVSVTIVARTGYDATAVTVAVEEAVSDYLNTLAISEDVLYAAIADVVYGVPGVINYSNLLVEGGTTDITIDADEKSAAGTIDASFV